MRKLMKLLSCSAALWMTLCVATAFGDNQTSDLSPVFDGSTLPFQLKIETAFEMPDGLHSGSMGTHDGKWLYIGGRTNGLHGFGPGPENFPPQQQNYDVYVIDPEKQTVFKRSLTDEKSGLTQKQIDLLTVTSPQFYQVKHTLYITGGYGVDSSTGNFSTKDALTAIDIPSLMKWVTSPDSKRKASKCIRQILDPIFQVTGGYMTKYENGPTLLVFGQNFQGFYTDSSNGDYTLQVRRFIICDDGKQLHIKKLDPLPEVPDANYRRRDLNVVPIMTLDKNFSARPGLIAFAGVFTESGGVWTVPVSISKKGYPKMADPNSPSTFKQAMNQYVCATMGLFSKESGKSYTVFFGGISFGFFENGQLQTDDEFPFINQVTTISIDKRGNYKQYLMPTEFPVIPSQFSNPGNTLLFGAGADFVPSCEVHTYDNGVIKLDKIEKCEKLAGYIVGGIMSTLPNTNLPTDSAASPYVFKVTIVPGKD